MAFDEPMDEGDIAADYQARLNKASIARARAVIPPWPDPPLSVAADCEWCGVEIPTARRAAYPGCTLCVQCQATKERLPGRAV